MSQKLSRRSFLKTAGAVAVAAAAMSTLTACGGGGGSSTPTNNVNNKSTLGSVDVLDAAHTFSRSVDENKIPYKWHVNYGFSIKNNGDKDIAFGMNQIISKMDGADRLPTSVFQQVDENSWRGIEDLTVKKGETVKIRIRYDVSKETYEEWYKGEGNHSLEVTLINEGKKITYKIGSDRKGTLSTVEDA